MLTPAIAAIVGTAGAPAVRPTPSLVCVGNSVRMSATDLASISFNPVIDDVTNDGAEVELVGLDPLPSTQGTVGRVGNVVTYTRAPGYAGTFELAYHARSATGAEASGLISFVIDGVTTPGFVTGVADTLDLEVGSASRDFDVLANDSGSGPIEIAPGSLVQPAGGPTLAIVGGLLRVTRNSAALGSYTGGSYRPRLTDGSRLGDPVPVTIRVVSATVTAPNFTVVVPITAASPFVIDALARCSGSGPLELHPTGLTAPTGSADSAAISGGKINYTRSTTPAGVYTMGYKARLVATPAVEATGTITIRVIDNWWHGRPRRGDRMWPTGYHEMGSSAATWVANNGNLDAYSGRIARPGTSDATWEGIWGGTDTEALSAVTVQANSQLDWSTGDFGAHARAMPVDGGFLLAECELFPASFQPASATDVRIWDLIDGGTLDAGYQRMGARLRSNLAALGWWDLDLFVLVPFPGMNAQTGICRVYSGSRARFRASMERVYAKLREGFGSRLRIAHVVARKNRLGASIQDWTPKNAAGGVDAVGLVFNPSALVTNEATFATYLDAWDAASYGMDGDAVPAAASLGVPLIVPKWGPLARVTAGENPCPAGDVVVQQFSKFLRARAKAKLLVCDCMSGADLLSTTAYAATDAAGIAAWSRMVADIRAIWKGAPLSPIPRLTAGTTTLTMGSSATSVDANPLADATGSETLAIRRVVAVPTGMTASVVGSGTAARVRINKGTASSGLKQIVPELALGSIPFFADGDIQLTVAGTASTRATPDNPFTYLSAHHRPLGAGVQLGIPPSVLATAIGAADADGDYTGATNTRGRIAQVGRLMRAGEEKPIHVVTASMTTRTVNKTPGTDPATGHDLPINIKMPDTPYVPYPGVGHGDSEVNFWPRNGDADDDLLDMFFQFRFASFTDIKASKVQTCRLSGMDTPTDGMDGGPSASRIRLPSHVLLGSEINGSNPGIFHPLNIVCTRHSHKERTYADSAPVNCHIMNDRAVWPAYGKDKFNPPYDAGTYRDNQGDIPYGTRLTFTDDDLDDLLALPGLTAAQIAMIWCWYCYGGMVADGHGDRVANPTPGDGRGPWLSVLRVREDGTVSTSVGNKLTDIYEHIFPRLWPVKNPRKHFAESEIFNIPGNPGHGYPYLGGGGPRHATRSINTAFDRPTAAGI
jgi:hypothetical protein